MDAGAVIKACVSDQTRGLNSLICMAANAVKDRGACTSVLTGQGKHMECLHKHRLHSVNTQQGKTIKHGNYSFINYTSCSQALQLEDMTLFQKGRKDQSAPAGTGLSSEHLHLTAGYLHRQHYSSRPLLGSGHQHLMPFNSERGSASPGSPSTPAPSPPCQS